MIFFALILTNGVDIELVDRYLSVNECREAQAQVVVSEGYWASCVAYEVEHE